MSSQPSDGKQKVALSHWACDSENCFESGGERWEYYRDPYFEPTCPRCNSDMAVIAEYVDLSQLEEAESRLHVEEDRSMLLGRERDEARAELKRMAFRDHDPDQALIARVAELEEALERIMDEEDWALIYGSEAKAVVARVAELEEALERIMRELGVPGDGYSYPVAKAHEVARQALAPRRENLDHA